MADTRKEIEQSSKILKSTNIVFGYDKSAKSSVYQEIFSLKNTKPPASIIKFKDTENLLTEPEQVDQFKTTAQNSFKIEPSEEFIQFLKEQPEMGKNIKKTCGSATLGFGLTDDNTYTDKPQLFFNTSTKDGYEVISSQKASPRWVKVIDMTNQQRSTVEEDTFVSEHRLCYRWYELKKSPRKIWRAKRLDL